MKAKKSVLNILLTSLVFVMALCTMLCGIGLLRSKTAFATDLQQGSYYHNQLSAGAKKFYDALASMEADGSLKTGNQKLDLVEAEYLTEDDVKAYQNGNSAVLKDFGSAKDAYFLDNPQLFYVDSSAISISMYAVGKNYKAYIDAGRTDTYYIPQSFASQQEVQTAISAYDNVILSLKTQLDAVEGVAEKVKLANDLVCDAVTYSFEADNAQNSAQIRTAYGALVNGKAVCEGYAKALQALLQTQGINCMEVVGYFNDDGNLEPHAWVDVQVDGKWYMVDSTMNDGEKDQNAKTLIGQSSAGEYIEDGKVSNSGFEFEYPTLATYNYGTEQIPTQVQYSVTGGKNWQDITFAYNDYSNATQMKDDGLYIVARHSYFKTDGTFGGWTTGYALYPYPYAVGNVLSVNSNTYLTQLVVTTQQPDMVDDTQAWYSSIDESKFVAKSDVICNEAYGKDDRAPMPQKFTPANNAHLDADKTYQISIKYDTKLQKKDQSKDVGIYVFSEKSANLSQNVTVEDVTFDGFNKVSFKFTPSKMYGDDMIPYHFIPTNLVGATELSRDKEPAYATYVFRNSWIVCNKILPDNRLYIDVFGEPTLIDSKDMSLTGFVDQNGNQIAESQRSQLVLVATKPTSQQSQDMLESATSNLGVSAQDVASSATFEIDLHVCGFLQQIPAGTYMKVAFGFPEGFGPEDKGVTFKVFHFKKGADGKIDPTQTEEVECVVTEYGIVATVSSFSPFAVVAVFSDKVAPSTKNVYVRTATDGGNVSIEVEGEATKNSIVALAKGQTATVHITADAGNAIDFVLLNRKPVEVKDGAVTLSYADLLQNNELSVSFVSQNVANFEEQNDMTSLNSTFAQNEVQNVAQQKTPSKAVTIAVFAVLAIALVACIWLFCKTSKDDANLQQNKQAEAQNKKAQK